MKKYVMVALLLAIIITACSRSELSRNNGIDVDLSVLSSTMVFAEVFKMTSNPNDYAGKTVKAQGVYETYVHESGVRYHFIVMADAAACCAQGMELRKNSDRDNPDGYPERQTKIEVTGVYSSYTQSGALHYYLAIDDMVILE